MKSNVCENCGEKMEFVVIESKEKMYEIKQDGKLGEKITERNKDNNEMIVECPECLVYKEVSMIEDDGEIILVGESEYIDKQLN